jgi:hypothetical protein
MERAGLRDAWADQRVGDALAGENAPQDPPTLAHLEEAAEAITERAVEALDLREGDVCVCGRALLLHQGGRLEGCGDYRRRPGP